MLGEIIIWTAKFISFLICYIFLSRVFSIPIALTLQFPRFIVFLMVYILDMLQVPMFFHIYNKGLPQIPILKKLFELLPDKENVGNSMIGRIAQHLGSVGLIFISIAPTFGGGIWSAVLFAHVLRLGFWRSFVFIAFGSLLGCLAVVYGFDAIFYWIGIVHR